MRPQKTRYAQVVEVLYNDESPEHLWILNAVEVGSNNITNTAASPITLRPLNSNVKRMPIKGEIVSWIEAPSNLGDSSHSIPEYYWVDIINTQSFINHNSLPKHSVIKNESTDTSTSDGNPLYGSSEDTDELGSTFEESEDIRPLQHYEGDYLIEGRKGNSIRFGTSIDKGLDQYPTEPFWAVGDGDNGDPILVIRNGQKSFSDTEGNDPGVQKFINENINHDDSSIYLTSTQLINLNPAWHTGNSGPMTSLGVWDGDEFQGKQILMNSDRLVFNSKEDSILMFSAAGIGLACGDALTLEASSKIEIDSADVLNLGQDADTDGEPVVLGDTLVSLLEDLCDKVVDIATEAASHFHPPYGTAPSIGSAPKWTATVGEVSAIKGQLSTMLSQYAFVKKKTAGNSANPDNDQNKNR